MSGCNDPISFHICALCGDSMICDGKKQLLVDSCICSRVVRGPETHLVCFYCPRCWKGLKEEEELFRVLSEQEKEKEKEKE